MDNAGSIGELPHSTTADVYRFIVPARHAAQARAILQSDAVSFTEARRWFLWREFTVIGYPAVLKMVQGDIEEFLGGPQ